MILLHERKTLKRFLNPWNSEGNEFILDSEFGIFFLHGLFQSGDDGFAPVVLAEALWDHVTLDQDELSFQSGDVIEVIDRRDRYWWWGRLGQLSGWCPSSFVSATAQ